MNQQIKADKKHRPKADQTLAEMKADDLNGQIANLFYC